VAKPREVADGLRQKGFEEREKTRHTFYHFRDSFGNKTRIYTLVSRGRAELGKPLMATMASQCKLSLTDFSRLIDCSLERVAYENLLRGKGHLECTGND
jgi:hypothetical protein